MAFVGQFGIRAPEVVGSDPEAQLPAVPGDDVAYRLGRYSPPAVQSSTAALAQFGIGTVRMRLPCSVSVNRTRNQKLYEQALARREV